MMRLVCRVFNGLVVQLCSLLLVLLLLLLHTELLRLLQSSSYFTRCPSCCTFTQSPSGFPTDRPVIVEIPHFGSMRGQERELILLRSDNGETWKEHQYDCKTRDLQELLAGMDEGKSSSLEDWRTGGLSLQSSSPPVL